MKTQAISAPVDRLTREAPKRQVGYGLPCAKCHKYFPADLEVCPICKGRERVSPVVAPRIPKPVQSATSVAPSSSNIALKKEVKESPKSESPALAPPIEIKVKDRPLDQKESITVQVVAELPVAAEPARPSLVSRLEEKEPPKLKSPAFAVPVEVHAVEVQAEDQTITQKESITIPALPEVQGTIEPLSDNAVTANDASLTREMESSTVATLLAGSVECPCLDQRLEPIVIPAVPEAPPSVAPVAESITPVLVEELPKELEAPAFSAPEQVRVEDSCLNDQSKNDQPNDDQPNREEPIAIPALVEAQASKALSIAIAPTHKERKEEEEKLATALETLAAVDPIQIAVVDHLLADQRQEDQRRDQINEALRIVIPMLVEAQASAPAPTDVAQEHKVEELSNDLESPTLDLSQQIAVEEQRTDRIYDAEPIVVPTLVEAQASEPALVTAEQKLLEQEKKAEVLEISETPTPAPEVKVVETKVIEVKTVESVAIVDQPNHRPVEEKSEVIDKGSDAPTKPADVNAPVVVHVNLGELQLGQLRAPKSTPDRAPALARLKEIERTEPATSSSDIASDVDSSESPALVSGRRFDLVTFALGVVVLACAVLLITLAALRLMPRHASEPVRRAKPAYSIAPATADQNTNASIPTPPPTALGNLSSNSPVVAPTAPAQSPAASASNPSSPGSERVLTLAPGLAEGNLLYRVEPDYPEEARRQGVQGPVVLDLHISKDGLVQGVDLVSGQPLLVQAATAAVKQWRFRTRYVNGNEVEMQARITLHFALPTP